MSPRRAKGVTIPQNDTVEKVDLILVKDIIDLHTKYKLLFKLSWDTVQKKELVLFLPKLFRRSASYVAGADMDCREKLIDMLGNYTYFEFKALQKFPDITEEFSALDHVWKVVAKKKIYDFAERINEASDCIETTDITEDSAVEESAGKKSEISMLQRNFTGYLKRPFEAAYYYYNYLTSTIPDSAKKQRMSLQAC